MIPPSLHATPESAVHAVVPAAGTGSRFGQTLPKQYAALLGRPVLSHALTALSGHPSVASVTVALAPDDRWYDDAVRPDFPEIMTVTGGANRADSVLAALRYVFDEHGGGGWALVHDAARPCLPPQDLDTLLDRGMAHMAGALLAVPVGDTLKREIEGQVDTTMDRTGIWAALTPQLFPVADLVWALEMALAEGDQPTDEAMAMERRGARPLLVEGSPLNIKITRPRDIQLAEFALRRIAEEQR